MNIRAACLLITVLMMASIIASTAFTQVPLEKTPFWTTSEQNQYSTGMIWRDCNNDGQIDVFYSNGNDIVKASNMIYLSNNGVMPSSASWYTNRVEYSGHCAVGDIDDDGYADFIVANFLGSGGFSTANNSELYINDGGLPDPTPAWYSADSMHAFSCALADFDNDGDLDVVFATGEGYQNHYEPDRIYENVAGMFASSSVWQTAENTAAIDVAVGDVDRDGDMDVAFCYDNRATSLYYNHLDMGGTIETIPAWQSSTVESGNTLHFWDVNNDDWLDLVVAYNNQLGGQGRFKVYFNDGAGNLNTVAGWQSATGGYGSALAFYDYDNDGDDDLAAGRWFTQLRIYENTGTTFTTSPVWTSTTSMVAEELAWVDIDGNGVENFSDTISSTPGLKLYYTDRAPLYSIDSVKADGVTLSFGEYCYDTFHGWVSLADVPLTDLVVFYRYSFNNDLAVSNWDTVNMVFASTARPRVDFYADNAFGPAPLSVQFYDSSASPTGWLWHFGDGDSSTMQDPLHEYQQPGLFDVTLSVTNTQGQLSRTAVGMVAVYADTMALSNEVIVSGEPLRIDVYARNYLPLTEFTLPFTWAEVDGVAYDSFSTAGLRTDYILDQSQPNYDGAHRRAIIRLKTKDQAALAPDTGAIISLFFTVSGSPADSASLTFTAYGGYAPEFVTYAGEYTPELIDANITSNCCIGVRGNIDGSPGDEVSLGDLTAIIDHLFISLNPPLCWAEANLDGSLPEGPGSVSLGDLTALVDILFISLRTPPPCP